MQHPGSMVTPPPRPHQLIALPLSFLPKRQASEEPDKGEGGDTNTHKETARDSDPHIRVLFSPPLLGFLSHHHQSPDPGHPPPAALSGEARA